MDFRMTLEQELQKRKHKNPKYSLRAFARDLDYSAGTLSHLITGKRQISAGVIRKLGCAMGLGDDELNKYKPTNKRAMKRLHEEDIVVQTMCLNAFSVEYNANPAFEVMTCLAATKDFNPDPVWLGKRLGITPLEAQETFQRLVEVGLLRKNEETGRWFRANSRTWVPRQKNKIEQCAHRNNAIKTMEEALSIAKYAPTEDSDSYSSSLAINKERIPEMMDELKAYVRKLGRKYVHLDKIAEKDEVISIQVSLFQRSK